MTAPLEVRYERLLRVYPAGYRRAHGADMLSTMLADAGSGQRWPRPGDAANLIFHGLRLRLFKRPRGGFFDTGWADAGALLGALAALVLLATRVPLLGREPLSAVVASGSEAQSISGLTTPSLALQGGAWAAVVLAALLRRRRTAALLAWAAVLAEVAPLPELFRSTPVPVVQGLWRPALALVAAVALTAAGPRGAAAVSGWRRLGTVMAALAVIDAIAVAFGPGTAGDQEFGGDDGYMQFAVGDLLGRSNPSEYWIEARTGVGMVLLLAAIAVSLLAIAVAVLTVPGRIRRRLVASVAPVVALELLVQETFDGWAYSNDHMGHPIPLVPVQWAALVGVPLLTLLLGLWRVRRRDETLRLAALGAAAERDTAETA